MDGSQPVTRMCQPSLKSKTRGAKREAEGCNRAASLSDVSRPFCLPASLAFLWEEGLGDFFTHGIAVGEEKRGLEEQHGWAPAGQGGRDEWQQSEGETRQKKGQQRD